MGVENMILKAEGLTKAYQGIEVLKGVDFSVDAGQTVAIMGPSGCGKSTLLRCITRLTEPDAGTVYFKDESLTEKSEKELRVLRRKMGFVFQGHNLISHMTTIENVVLGLVMAGLDKHYAFHTAEETLSRT